MTATTTTRKRAAKAAPAPAKRAARPRKAAAAAAEAEETVAEAPAKRTRKTPAKEAAPKVRATKGDPSTWPKSGKNPYRPGSNLAKITDILLKGGVRSTLVAKLADVIDMHPYTKVKADLDVNKELDKRLMLTAGLLERDFNFTIVKKGRGMNEGTIKVVPPAA